MTFLGKILEMFGQKGAQNDFFLVLRKFNGMNFSDFLHEVTAA